MININNNSKANVYCEERDGVIKSPESGTTFSISINGNPEFITNSRRNEIFYDIDTLIILNSGEITSIIMMNNKENIEMDFIGNGTIFLMSSINEHIINCRIEIP